MSNSKVKKIHKSAGKQASRQCIACDSKKFVEYGKDLVQCIGCGLVVAKEIPTFEELKKLYSEEYFFGMEYSDYQVDRPALEKNFKMRVKHLRPYLNKDAKVIEVGCAYGYFLNMIKDSVAWHKGYDVSKEGIDYAKKDLGINATTIDFLDDSTIKQSSINLICMWDVIEHLGEPEKHISKAAKVLKPGGVVSLTTGDIGAYVARKRGDKWRMVHPPTHIYYFNEKSIRELFAKYGLEVVSIRHKSTHRNTGSVFNQLIVNKKALKRSPKLLETTHKIAKATRMDKINFPLNLFDVMEVTAVKK